MLKKEGMAGRKRCKKRVVGVPRSAISRVAAAAAGEGMATPASRSSSSDEEGKLLLGASKRGERGARSS